MASRVEALIAGNCSTAAPLNCDAIEPGLASAIMQAPSQVQRWMLAPPRDPPRWRTSLPPDGMGSSVAVRDKNNAVEYLG
jgi:hypothetical protein